MGLLRVGLLELESYSPTERGQPFARILAQVPELDVSGST